MTAVVAACLSGVLVAAAPALAQRCTPLQIQHPAGAAGDRFGNAVAAEGDTMIVGAPSDDVGTSIDQGSAHLYRWTGSGWTFEATLTAADGDEFDNFGSSVAVSGDTALVGAAWDDVGGNADQGSAYVFTRSGTTWTQQARLTAAGGAANDRFGNSVALGGDGGTALVGAAWDDVGTNADQGSAYVFVRSPGGTTWTQQAQLTATGGAANDRFGDSVALDGAGDTALVGADYDDVGANADQGSAYVFVRSPGGTIWTRQAQLTAAVGAVNDNFGSSVALSGDTALVGARLDDVGASPDQGSAYVFVRQSGGTTWTQQAQLTGTGGGAGDLFGDSVALGGAGDTALVGAWAHDVGTTDVGSAFVFVRPPGSTSWTQQAELTAAGGALNDNFGYSVALGGGGETAVVGAYLDDVGANANQGSAWIFFRAGSAWVGPDMHFWSMVYTAARSFGRSVSMFSDTAVIGAPTGWWYGGDVTGAAVVYVRPAGSTEWTYEALLRASDAAIDDRFGFSVSISNDTVVVGADGDDLGGDTDQGSAYVFLRNGTEWTQQDKLIASDGASGDRFGFAVDVYADTVVVGVWGDDVGGDTDQGSAYVFGRNGTQWTQQAKLTAADGATGDWFGQSVAIASDIIVVGADGDDIGSNTSQGSAYIFVRPSGGTTWTQQAKLTAADGAAHDSFGTSVALSRNTVVVGAPADDVGSNPGQGSAYVFVRSGTTWTQQARLTAADGAASDGFGESVAVESDRALVGARYDDVGDNVNQGSVYLFERSGIAWTEQAKLVAAGGQANGGFYPVTLSGTTAIVGAWSQAYVMVDQGMVYVFDLNICRPPCPADFNGSGAVSVQDIFDFLAAYFTADPRADFNGSGAISVQDIFDFLAAYFAGCP